MNFTNPSFSRDLRDSAQVDWPSALDYLAWKSLLPLSEKIFVFLAVPELVGKHDRDLINDRIEPPAFVTEEHPIHDQVSLGREFQQLERVVLVNRACQNIQELPLHAPFPEEPLKFLLRT